MRNRLTVLAQNTALFAGSALFALVVAEGILRLSFSTPELKERGVRAVLESYQNNYLQGFTATKEGKVEYCNFNDLVMPSPRLGFVRKPVRKRVDDCNYFGNNLGFNDPFDVAPEKDPNFFNIIVSGGSVADWFSFPHSGNNRILAEELNRRFHSPSGRPFRVMNFSMGAGAMPFQLFVLHEYGDLADAFLVLDGFNEAAAAQGARLDQYGHNLNSLQRNLFLSLTRDFVRALRRTGLRVPVLRDTYLLYFSFLSGTKAIERWSEDFLAELRRDYFRVRIREEHISPTENSAWFEYYERQLHSIARVRGLRYAHFLQPTPLLYKSLTERERGYYQVFSKEHYARIEEIYLAMAAKGYPVRALTRVFEKETGEIYSDYVHFAREAEGALSRGDQLVARMMATELGKMWRLKEK